MIDLGISKLALIGVVALVVLGPEKLPRVARTLGTWVGKAQHYVNEVKAEFSRTVELDELRKARDSVEQVARDAVQQVQQSTRDVQNNLDGLGRDVAQSIHDASHADWASSQADLEQHEAAHHWDAVPTPVYRHPRKNWRVRRGAVPRWYKQRHRMRTYVQSGAARVARYRPSRASVR